MHCLHKAGASKTREKMTFHNEFGSILGKGLCFVLFGLDEPSCYLTQTSLRGDQSNFVV